jgi:hypothetical protein
MARLGKAAGFEFGVRANILGTAPAKLANDSVDTPPSRWLSSTRDR